MTAGSAETQPPSTAGPRRGALGFSLVLVVGVIAATLASALLLSGVILLGANAAQGDRGSIRTEPIRLTSDATALTSEPMLINVADDPAARNVLAHAVFTLSATSDATGQAPFIGIAATSDVDRYLADVPRSTLSTLSTTPDRSVFLDQPGSRTPAVPASQTFWAASSSTGGPVVMAAEPGSWTVVVMNADAQPAIDVTVRAGVRSDLFAPVGTVLTAVGVLLLAAAILLIVASAVRLGRGLPERRDTAAMPAPRESAPYPAHLTGTLDAGLSRGLWLVKWFLAIPHLIVLAFLWAAFALTTVIAWFAILITAQYPAALFAFNVGVIRWSWRVAFYAFAPMGTDRYPPFTLSETDYPATFTVARPDRYSRGLLFVKSWLLAIPHLVILGVLTTSATTLGADTGTGTGTDGISFSLLGVLSLIAGIILLVTGRYQPALFALIMGISRWQFRVVTYVTLLRDEYPPFRLDQGPNEPGTREPETHEPRTREPDAINPVAGTVPALRGPLGAPVFP